MQKSLSVLSSLKSSRIASLAKKSGWFQRKAKILTPVFFVKALVASVAVGDCSLRSLATEVGLLIGSTLSKQAMSNRLNSSSVRFLKLLVGDMLAKIPEVSAFKALPGVGRILVGDSSTLTLHPSLMDHFPGSTNQHGVATAQVRFQFTFDLLSGQWLQTKLDPYNRNDRTAALDIVGTIVKKGDLVLRDLGYATLKCFKAIQDQSAYFLSRLNPSVKVLNTDQTAINLLALARKMAPNSGDSFSQQVLLGLSQHLPCRIVVIRVPQEVGDKRRRRLRKQAKRQNFKHRKEYLELQNWTFLVTNLEPEQATLEQLEQLYRTRWRIENIFKIAKSQTPLPKIAKHQSNRYHIETLLWAWMLLMIGLSQHGIFRLRESTENSATGIEIKHSVFKSIKRILQWAALSIELASAGSIQVLFERLQAQMDYHDRYEKRERISLPRRLSIALEPQFAISLT